MFFFSFSLILLKIIFFFKCLDLSKSIFSIIKYILLRNFLSFISTFYIKRSLNTRDIRFSSFYRFFILGCLLFFQLVLGYLIFILKQFLWKLMIFSLLFCIKFLHFLYELHEQWNLSFKKMFWILKRTIR